MALSVENATSSILVTVIADILMVRDEPSQTAPVLGMANKGLTGIVEEGPVSAEGHTWYKVRYSSGLNGWVSDVGLEIR